jgi:pimeloyl-ACP methyl ester carboxylesterase
MATAPSKITVVLVRGLLGLIFSRGMDALAEKLKTKGYNAQVWNHSFLPIWPFWFGYVPAIAGEVEKLTKAGQIVLIGGHSFGGTTALMVARLLPGWKCKALFAVDPAAQYDCSVPTNVERAFGFRNNVGGLGMGKLTPARSGIVDISLSQVHGYMDDDPRVHDRIIAEIAKL